jgi:acetylornithine/succinyldiaminopimelate/putrescine aminotransferase/predicted amino acid dehydrogenase
MDSQTDDANRTESGVTFHKPLLSHWLSALGLNQSYVRASGAWLFPSADSSSLPVLDCVGGYGALLLGHAHPRLNEIAAQFFRSERPNLVQGNWSATAEQFASDLSERCGGGYRIVYSSSGAEAVEVALKHAMLENGKRSLLSLDGGFHGKTIAAVQVTSRAEYRTPFTLDSLHVHRAVPNDIEGLHALFAHYGSSLTAMIVEPIQGEAGVKTLDGEFLRTAQFLCNSRNVPLIADECHTGVGRTGEFLGSQHHGIRPDYIILSKALGGGIAKIAATLIDQDRYHPEFDWVHSSTFAADEFSCTIAAEVLKIVDADFLEHIVQVGDELLGGLRQLKDRWPRVIADVRGQGLMMGVELYPLVDSPSFLLRLLSGTEDTSYLSAAYLLHQHRLRVMPTLSNPNTLRLQPPAIWNTEQTDHVIAALDALCSLLDQGKAQTLAASLLDRESPRDQVAPRKPPSFPSIYFNHTRFNQQQMTYRSETPCVAWLCHMIDADDLLSVEPGIEAFSFEQREQLLQRMTSFTAPVVMSSVEVSANSGESVRLYPIMLPFTSRMARNWIETQDFAWARHLIDGALGVAASLGCQLTALGQYTSILTRNGKSISPSEMAIASGNSYTVALTLQAIQQAIEELGLDSAGCTLAVIGGVGNIGQICAKLLAPGFQRTLIVSGKRPRSMARAAELVHSLPRAKLVEIDECRGAEVMLCAVSSPEPILQPAMLDSTRVLCDVSVPSAIDYKLVSELPSIRFVTGGLAKLPGGEDLDIAGFPLPVGQTFGCMAEALLLGLAGHWTREFTGSVTEAKIEVLEALGLQYGFGLAASKEFCVFGSSASTGMRTSALNSKFSETKLQRNA